MKIVPTRWERYYRTVSPRRQDLGRLSAKYHTGTVVGNFLSEVGQHLGDAVGTVLARKIDPEHGKNKTDEVYEE